MGKQTVYICDECKKQFKNKKEVFKIKGDITDGEDEIIIEKNLDEIFCIDCLVDKIKYNEIKVPKEQISDNLEDYTLLKRISTPNDEIEFIQYLGFVNIESFKKTYNKSIYNCFYPIENDSVVSLFNNREEVDLIYKVLAGIPQIKKQEVFVDDESNFGFILTKTLQEIQ